MQTIAINFAVPSKGKKNRITDKVPTNRFSVTQSWNLGLLQKISEIPFFKILIFPQKTIFPLLPKTIGYQITNKDASTRVSKIPQNTKIFQSIYKKNI